MRPPKFNTGDLVTHFREPGNVGTVVRVIRLGHLRRRWVYYVQWRPQSDPVPLRDGLQHADEHAQSKSA